MATIRVYIDGSSVAAASTTTATDINAAWSLKIGPLSEGAHTLAFTVQNAGDIESAPKTVTITCIAEEERDNDMPAHTVNESSGTAGATAALIDPTPNAKRYKVVLVNTSPTDYVWVGYTSGVTVGGGQRIDPDFGEKEFFIDSNQRLYAIRGGTANISVLAREYCTV